MMRYIAAAIKWGKLHSFEWWIQIQIIVHSFTHYHMVARPKICEKVTMGDGA